MDVENHQANAFEMVTIDVTPSPYDQPPYPADGTTCTVINGVEAVTP